MNWATTIVGSGLVPDRPLSLRGSFAAVAIPADEIASPSARNDKGKARKDNKRSTNLQVRAARGFSLALRAPFYLSLSPLAGES